MTLTRSAAAGSDHCGVPVRSEQRELLVVSAFDEDDTHRRRAARRIDRRDRRRVFRCWHGRAGATQRIGGRADDLCAQPVNDGLEPESAEVVLDRRRRALLSSERMTRCAPRSAAGERRVRDARRAPRQRRVEGEVLDCAGAALRWESPRERRSPTSSDRRPLPAGPLRP
jgi:hypothetical protein